MKKYWSLWYNKLPKDAFKKNAKIRLNLYIEWIFKKRIQISQLKMNW